MAKHILLAEDSVTMQKAIEMTLAGEDVTLTVTANVDEALARARQRRPDLVLADLSLPGKNGYDLAAAIKQEDRSIPVLLLHGSAVTFDPQRAMRSGADGEVVKPFETQLLIDRLWALMDGSEAAAMPGPVEPLGEPLSGSTLAPAGAAVAASAARRAAPAPRSVGAGPPLGTISTAPGTGSGVLPPPAAARPVAAVPAAAAPAAPRPAAAAPVAPRPAPAAPVAAVPAAPRPVAAPVAPRPVAAPAAPRPVAAAPAAPRPVAAAPVAAAPVAPRPVAPRPQPLPPLPEAAALASEPTALEITIEAELPPAVLAEPLPSFDVPATTDIGRGEASPAGFAPVHPPRPSRTLAGWGEGGLPPPPPGMPLPRAAAAGAGAPIAPPAAARELDPAAYEAIVKLSREVIERVAWEIVPELAETIIREQLERVLAQRSK